MREHQPFTSYRGDFIKTRFTPTPFSEISVARLLGVYPEQREVVVDSDDDYTHGPGAEKWYKRMHDKYGPIGSSGMGRMWGPNKVHIGLDHSAPLSLWAPTTSEVEVILSLAKAAAPDKEKPKILDLESGTGFLAYTLAQTGLVEVVSSDHHQDWLKANSPHFDHLLVEHLNLDPWEAAKRYSPKYDRDLSNQRRGLIEVAHHLYEICESGFSATVGRPKLEEQWLAFTKGVLADLEESPDNYIGDTEIDLAISSCAPVGFDPTMLLRDIVHPKVIVYIGDTSIYNPAGSGVVPMDIPRSMFIDESYNPGKHYRELERWWSFSEELWGHYNFKFDPKTYKDMVNRAGVQVMIQTRKDFELGKIEKIKIPSLPWEEELMRVRGGVSAPADSLYQVLV